MKKGVQINMAEVARIIPESITRQTIKRDVTGLNRMVHTSVDVCIGDGETPSGIEKYVQVGSDRQVAFYLVVMGDKKRFAADDLLRAQPDLAVDHLLEFMEHSMERIRRTFEDGEKFVEGPYAVNAGPLGEASLVKLDRVGIWYPLHAALGTNWTLEETQLNMSGGSVDMQQEFVRRHWIANERPRLGTAESLASAVEAIADYKATLRIVRSLRPVPKDKGGQNG